MHTQKNHAADGGTHPTSIPDVLTLEEAAAILRISRNTAY